MANRRFIDFPIAASVGNNDIVLIWQDGLNKQTTKATLFAGSPSTLASLTDVDISALTNGQILQYNSTTSKWENVNRTDIDLDQLGDVTIVSPTNGQVLVYNSSTSKWENSSGGFVPYTGAVTTVNLGAQSILAGSFVKAGGTASQFLKANGSVDSTAYGTGSVTSVALTMPSAFSVANSPITTAGTLAVTGAGTVAQYVRGDGSLADFPESSGGGSSVSYYLNGSVSQGTIGGVAYLEMNKVPILGAGTDFTRNSNGYIASFITDAGDPNLLEIPAGNWNFESYFSASSGGGSPTFYVELYKVNSGGTATLIASNSANPELIFFGTTIAPYFSSLAVPTTVLALTDRLAVRYYVTPGGRTLTLHTEGPHLCQIITTFTTGLTALNGLTAQVQNFAVGTSGTDFNIASATATHTFNLPTASATNRGALSSADWTTFNNKENAITAGTTAQYYRGDKTFQTLNTSVVPELTNLYYTEARVNANANVAANTAARHNAVTLGTANGLSLSTQQLSLGLASAGVTGALSGTDWSTFNSKQQALNGTGFVKISGTTISYDNSTYLTTAAAASTYLALAGGTMTGNINWTANDVGLTWSRNTDGAAIKFISVGDGTGESYLQIGTSDNGNEAIVFTQTSLIRVQIDTDGLLKNGSSQRYVFENGGTWGIGITGNAGTVTNGVYTSRTITINGTTQDLSANRTYNVGTVTSVAALTLGTSGTDLSSTVANSTTTPVITLNVPTASATNRGALSAADWTTFNNKQNALTNPVTGTGTTNYLPKFTGASTIGNSQIFDNGTNVGVGTASPSYKLDVNGVAQFRDDIRFSATNSSIGYTDAIRFVELGVATRMTLSSGNLGLGVTPSAWNSAYKAFQFGTTGALFGESGDAANYFTTNTFVDSVGFKYITSDWALGYFQENGVHSWRTAPSGTAGNAISFTQAMTLGSNSGLSIGTPSAAPSQGLLVQGNVGIGGSIFGKLSVEATGNHITLRAPGATAGKYWALDVTTANQLYVINNAGTQYFTMTDAGNFGIGTASPNYLLHIAAGAANPQLQFTSTGTGSTTSDGFHIGVNNSTLNAFLLQKENAALQFLTNDTERMRITSGGNVLVGTTTATGSLNTEITINNSSAGNYAGIGFKTADTNRGYIGATSTSIEIGAIGFTSFYTGGSERMRISSSGNLLISTTTDIGSPYRLQVNGRIQLYGAELVFSGDENKSINVYSNRSLSLSTNDTARLTITGGGNVLIGTTTDVGGRLGVKSSGTNTSPFVIQRSANTNTLAAISETSAGDASFFLTSALGSTNIQLLSNGNSILNGGNVLIGTTTDTSDKLRVNGTTFSNDIMTWNPQNDNRSGIAWRFGEASIASITPNRRLRVSVGGTEYYIGAIEV